MTLRESGKLISLNKSIFGFLGFGGYNEEYINYRLNQIQLESAIKTNISVSKTNKIQKISIYITIAILLTSVASQVFSYCVSKKSLSIQEKELSLKLVQQYELESNINGLQNQIDSILKSVHKEKK